MSARVSARRAAAYLVAGPIVALINQEAIYATNMWACGHESRGVMHLVPLLGLAVSATVTLLSYGAWRESSVAGTDSPARSSRRFLALSGAAIGAFSSALIIAQWTTIIVFAPCMRS